MTTVASARGNRSQAARTGEAGHASEQVARNLAQPPPSRPIVVGIDFRTACIDLVRLPLDDGLARWHHIPLNTKARGIDQARPAYRAMPKPGWWDGVYLVAIEKPMGWHLKALAPLMRLQGVLAIAVPFDIELWELPPEEWKQGCGLASRAKMVDVRAFVASKEDLLADDPADWSDDACAAFCMAWAARTINERGTADG